MDKLKDYEIKTNKLNYNVIYYYSEYDMIKYIEDADDTNELKTIEPKEINKPEHKFHYFRMFETYEASYNGLLAFKIDFNKWCNEIQSVPIKDGRKNYYYKLNYKKFLNHNNAVYSFFQSNVKSDRLESFESIDEDEFYIFERCLNSGLITLNLSYKNQPINAYGYDFSRYYPNMLLNLKLPTKPGKKYKLTEFESYFRFGIYRVKINYTNAEFTNIFNFSKLNHYSSTTLNYLKNVKDKYGLTFTLLTDDDYDYNAYIYEEEDLISGEKLFTKWFAILELLRSKNPKNRLIKHLMSSLWGTLSSYKNIYIKQDEISEYDITYLDEEENSEYKIMKNLDSGDYKCVKSSDAYNYGLARIKPFLTSYARTYIMKFLHKCNIDESSIVRIHTDGLVFNKEIDFESMNLKYYPKPEDKTTGLINFKNAIYGFHICPCCNNEFSYKSYVEHSKICI